MILISKLLHHVTILRNLQAKVARKGYFNIFYHIIVTVCDVLEKFYCNHKIKYVGKILNLQKEFVVSTLINKIFILVKYRVYYKLDY